MIHKQQKIWIMPTHAPSPCMTLGPHCVVENVPRVYGQSPAALWILVFSRLLQFCECKGGMNKSHCAQWNFNAEWDCIINRSNVECQQIFFNQDATNKSSPKVTTLKEATHFVRNKNPGTAAMEIPLYRYYMESLRLCISRDVYGCSRCISYRAPGLLFPQTSSSWCISFCHIEGQTWHPCLIFFL